MGQYQVFSPRLQVHQQLHYFDYQRERVYVRTSKLLKKKLRERKKASRPKLRVTTHIFIVSLKCPF